MPLSQIQITKISENVNSKCKNFHCASCGNNNFSLNPELLFMPEIDTKTKAVSQNGFSFVVFTCNDCSSVVLFNAGAMGLM